MKDLNWDDKGYLVDGKRISHLRFADDIITGTIKATLSTAIGSATFASPTILFSTTSTWDDKGYFVDGKRISNLRFADDIVLISTSTSRSRGNAERAQCGRYEDWIGHEYV
ncbi:unnamed protein product [Heligmosomoides polygyrus]|uniref:Reverse transcriptase domain-containing protein n=1 Tax=Heligmosomoides polygyrus TaxID=6339 RepID=A0A183GD74_HELPZ|nr:unnamed protein product [Heligmosomoides polygyrus]